MMRIEKEDLEDPGLANAYRMTPENFKARYAYLFPEEPEEKAEEEKEK